MRFKVQHFIIPGIILGIVLGYCLSQYAEPIWREKIILWLNLFGKTIFIGALKMIVAPLIFFSILSAITSLATTGELWRIGWKTLVYYLATTSIAVAIGLFFVLTIQPGLSSNRAEIRQTWQERRGQLAEEYYVQEEKIHEAEGQNKGVSVFHGR